MHCAISFFELIHRTGAYYFHPFFFSLESVHKITRHNDNIKNLAQADDLLDFHSRTISLSSMTSKTGHVLRLI